MAKAAAGRLPGINATMGHRGVALVAGGSQCRIQRGCAPAKWCGCRVQSRFETSCGARSSDLCLAEERLGCTTRVADRGCNGRDTKRRHSQQLGRTSELRPPRSLGQCLPGFPCLGPRREALGTAPWNRRPPKRSFELLRPHVDASWFSTAPGGASRTCCRAGPLRAVAWCGTGPRGARPYCSSGRC